MAQRQRSKAPPSRQGGRRTNWAVVAGVIGAGALVVIAFLFMAPGETRIDPLGAYCDGNPSHCVVEGAADAPVTVVEISDYNCSHCRDFNTSTASALRDEYVDTGRVRWIVLPFALGPTTVPAASAALCAAAQGQAQFSRMHAALFGLQGAGGFSREGIMGVASQVGLDMNGFSSCVDTGTYASVVEANIRQADASGVSATPSFFIDGVKLEGNHPLASFQQRIDNALAANQ